MSHQQGYQQAAPGQPGQMYFTQPGYGPPTQMFPPQPTKVKMQLNVPGLIALIAAVLGFIFACTPGALIVGWILLPIAFVLALVSLFLKDKAKWMGITALITSIVGTIVGFIVFFAVVGTSFDNAFGGGDIKVSAKEGAAAEAGTREKPSPIGSVIESDDWRVIINSVTLAASDAVATANQFNEPPAEGSEYIIVNYSATYIGDEPNGQTPGFVTIEYVTADGTTVTRFAKIAVAPEPIDTTSTLYKDGTATGNIAIEVPTATVGQGVLAVRPGMFADKVFVAVQ